jgi:hypothetical protein
MGEKGNLLDTTEAVFENLAEQGPQFWLSYEQFKQARTAGAQAPVVAGQQAAPGTGHDAIADAGHDAVAHDDAG